MCKDRLGLRVLRVRHRRCLGLLGRLVQLGRKVRRAILDPLEQLAQRGRRAM